MNRIIATEGPTSTLLAAIGSYVKGKLSIAVYGLAIPMAFVNQWLSDGLYVLVALMGDHAQRNPTE